MIEETEAIGNDLLYLVGTFRYNYGYLGGNNHNHFDYLNHDQSIHASP